MKLNKTLLFFLIILSISAYRIDAQTISGNVKDVKTNNPISNVKVLIKNVDNGLEDAVFTNASGNWSYTLITSVNDGYVTIPGTLIVDQNYPNPFNPSTRIQFSVPQDGMVQLTVHNILGELIDQISQYLTSGNYSVNWVSKGSAGVYFYTIKTDNHSITKKMVQLDGSNGTGLDRITSGVVNNTPILNKENSVNIKLTWSKIGYVSDSIQTSVNSNEFFERELITVHSNALMIDLHNDVIDVLIRNPNYNFSIWNTINHTDIPRLQAGEVDIQFFAMWVNPNSYSNHYAQTITMINRYFSIMSESPDEIQHAVTMDEAALINQQGKIAAMIGVEGGHSIENSLEKLENLYNAGMR